MGLTIITFVVTFVLLGSGGLLLFYRDQTLLRISEVIHPRAHAKSVFSTIHRTGLSLSGVVEHLDHVLPKSHAEVSIVSLKLIRAGYRNESAVRLFYGSKVVVPLFLCLVLLISRLGHLSPFIIYIGTLGVGFLVPDFWLGRKIARRQKCIRRGLPDVLDLLVICIEAGLGLDQATARTAEELQRAQPEMCDELNLVVLEQRAGRLRSEAWRHMAERTGVDAVRNLVSMLVQSDHFGTSVAKTLRIHSDSLRTQRIQAVEEMAAKTTIKLVFPLVLFVFPSLFVVTLGPAVISMMDSFKAMHQ